MLMLTHMYSKDKTTLTVSPADAALDGQLLAEEPLLSELPPDMCLAPMPKVVFQALDARLGTMRLRACSLSTYWVVGKAKSAVFRLAGGPIIEKRGCKYTILMQFGRQVYDFSIGTPCLEALCLFYGEEKQWFETRLFMS